MNILELIFLHEENKIESSNFNRVELEEVQSELAEELSDSHIGGVYIPRINRKYICQGFPDRYKFLHNKKINSIRILERFFIHLFTQILNFRFSICIILNLCSNLVTGVGFIIQIFILIINEFFTIQYT